MEATTCKSGLHCWNLGSMASLVRTSCGSTIRRLLVSPITRHPGRCVHAYCTQAVPRTRNVVDYPPVKPKYPPGTWGKLVPNLAWKVYEEDCLPLHDIPNVKERLEWEAGSKEIPHWDISALDRTPGRLTYKQHITKTHVIKGLPDIYANELPNDIDELCERLKPHICDAVIQEAARVKPEQYHRHCQAHNLVGHIISAIYMHLGLHNEHLMKSQYDENVRLETYWKKGGYSEPDDGVVKNFKEMRAEICRLQLKHNINHQLRTEYPLPEFLPIDSAECAGDYAHFDYKPEWAGQHYTLQRPITVSGHWIGDPCEFGLVSFHVLDDSYDKLIEEYGHSSAESETISYGLVTSFGSALTQAYNQGFNSYFDLTYPLTTQTVVTDGQQFRFCSYQLNTARLWVLDEQNPLRNLLWTTDLMSLYEAVEGGEVKGFNDEVLKHLLQFVLLKPRDRGVDLRPYLPLEASPLSKDKYINHVGEEVIEEPKIGRWQYPRNAVYF